MDAWMDDNDDDLHAYQHEGQQQSTSYRSSGFSS